MCGLIGRGLPLDLDKIGIYSLRSHFYHGGDQLGYGRQQYSVQPGRPLVALAIILVALSLAPQLVLGASADAREKRGDTALMAAVRLDDVARVRQLLDTGPDPNVSNKFGATALFFAASQAIEDHMQQTSAQILKTLLQHGARVNAQTENGQSALIAAASKGSIENVEILLAAGAKPNLQSKNGDFALLEATAHGYTDIVIVLLQAGANANLKDVNGQSPLMIAIRQAPQFSSHKSLYEIISDALLAHGANPNSRDQNGQSPVTMVAAGDKNVLIYPLLDHHADINVTDPTANGATAIIIAARHGNTPMVKALLRAHPKLSCRDLNGKTALDYAKQSQFNEIVSLLSQTGSSIK